MTIYVPLPLLLVVCNTLWYLPLETLLILLPITYLLQHSILQTLKTCIDGGRVTTKPGWHRKLKSEWWSKVVPYFLYACSCGSLDTVKYLIDSGKEPNVRYIVKIVHYPVSICVSCMSACDCHFYINCSRER